MDDAICVWDVESLDENEAGPAYNPLLGRRNEFGHSPGNIPVRLERILRGHHGTVNWASFSRRKQPVIVSGSSDHVHLWHVNDETNRCEFETLVGHTDDVTCVVFHPTKHEIFVSASKDKTIRIWDTTSRTQLHTFGTDDDRFWSLAAHPETSLLAAGHDSGLMVFKLERERPAFALSDDFLLFVKDNFLWSYEFSTNAESKVIPIRRRPGILNQSPRTLSYSHKDKAALIVSDLDGGSYELYFIPEDSIGILRDAKTGTGRSAVFVAKSRFAVREKSTNQVSVMDLNNEVVRRRTLPIPADAIFYAGTGIVLCRSAVKVFLFDLRKNLVIGELETPNIVRYIVWSNDKERVALLSKDTIVIASKKLVHQFTLCETTHVKSGAWNDNGVLIYTTLNHLKYCLSNGRSGIIFPTKNTPLYITKVSGESIFSFNRDGDCLLLEVDPAKYRSTRFDMADDGEAEEVQGLDAEGNGWATFDSEDLPSLFDEVELPEWVSHSLEGR